MISNFYVFLGAETIIVEADSDHITRLTETKMRLQYTSLRLDPLYIKVACWTYLAIMYIVPFLALLFFNLRYCP